MDNNQFNGQAPMPQPPMAPLGNGEQPGKQFALIGLICGIASLVLSEIPCFVAWSSPVVAIILSVIFLAAAIAGIIFGVMGGKKNLEVGSPKGGLAKAALIVGIIATVYAGIFFICTGCNACTRCTLESAANKYSTASDFEKAASGFVSDLIGELN